VRTTIVRIGAGAAIATALLLALVLAFPGRRATFAAGYALVLGALAVVALVASLRSLLPAPWERSPFERRRDEPAGPPAIDELERIDRLVVLGCSNAFDLHYRLRPLLRDLTSERLHAAHGAELERDSELAAQLLGDELWSVVRPDRELGRRHGPGLGTADLRRIVERLEAL
jgi:hypothetical protein